ncbi:hypothetical protein DN402_09160 [Streptomyces sp. SW4]|nr:hypothetical protein DN402_09160 [Streptomyces sp. SW4]
MAPVAILLLVADQGGALKTGGLLCALYGLASAVGQPVLGRMVDRRGQTLVTAAAVLLTTVCLLALSAVDVAAHVGLAAGLVALAGLSTPPLEAGLRALWPVVLPDEARRRAALALDTGTQGLIYVTGPPLVAVLSATTGPRTAIQVTAALGLLSAIVVLSAAPSRHWRPAPRPSPPGHSARSPTRASVAVRRGERRRLRPGSDERLGRRPRRRPRDGPAVRADPGRAVHRQCRRRLPVRAAHLAGHAHRATPLVGTAVRRRVAPGDSGRRPHLRGHADRRAGSAAHRRDHLRLSDGGCPRSGRHHDGGVRLAHRRGRHRPGRRDRPVRCARRAPSDQRGPSRCRRGAHLHRPARRPPPPRRPRRNRPPPGPAPPHAAR